MVNNNKFNAANVELEPVNDLIMLMAYHRSIRAIALLQSKLTDYSQCKLGNMKSTRSPDFHQREKYQSEKDDFQLTLVQTKIQSTCLIES